MAQYLEIITVLKKGPLVMDGAMGTLLQSRGLPLNTPADIWNIEKPDEVLKVHQEYIKAGSRLIFTNTFCGMPEMIPAGCALARKAAGEKTFVAGSLGPTENLNEKTIELLLKQQIDLVVFETMTKHSILEAAVKTTQRINKKIKKIPIMVLMTLTRDGLLPSGEDPLRSVAWLENQNVEIVGLNCSFGPELMFPVFEKIKQTTKCFVAVKPNEKIEAKRFIEAGANLIGGCCGTTPEDIRELARMLRPSVS